MSLNLKELLIEGLKDARAFVENGLINSEDFNALVSIDFTPKKKYIHWIVKTWVSTPEEERPAIESLRDYIKKYDNLVNRNRVEKKDIYQVSNFKELEDIISIGEESKSKKDKSNDYEVLVDNDNVIVFVPHSHEAARMLGMKYFNFREEKALAGGSHKLGFGEDPPPPQEPKRDCAWCIAYKNETHWADYYYNEEITFYLILIKSDELRNKVREYFDTYTNEYDGIAVGVYTNGEKFGYTGLDHTMDDKDLKAYLKIVGLE